MNKLFKVGTLAALISSANAYAHHPAVDMVDPDVYAMIEENISEVHLALDFDDMGSSTETGGAMASSDDAGNMGGAMEAGDGVGNLAADMGSDVVDISTDLAEAGSAMADMEPGSMSRR